MVALAIGGCRFKGERGGETENADLVNANNGQADGNPAKAWWPQPKEVKVYPATQFIERDGQPMLKASIELLDALGDSVKGPGHLRCELLARKQLGGVGEQLYRWDVSLRTLKQQRRYFDLVTRTYILRLSLDDQAAANNPTVLRVTFTQPEGPRLQTERALPIEW